MVKFKELWQNKTIRCLFVAIAALLLLFAIWRCFFYEEKTASYIATEEEARLSELLASVDGVSSATVLIGGQENAESAVIVYEGTDSILVRMRILEIVSAALCIEKSNVQVYPAS